MQLLDRVERKSDASFEHEKTLINRFSAGVSNEALQRELRRLKVDRPDLSFWEFRKRAIDFLGKQSVDFKKKATISEAHVGVDNYSKKKRVIKQSKDAFSGSMGIFVKLECETFDPLTC